MRYLKPFNESVETNKRLSVEDLEDYFLEFIDNGSMEFYYNGIPISGSKVIETTFKLSSKFRNVTSIQELNNLSNLINQIGDVVKRWNLDFKFSTIAIGNKPGGGGPQQTQLTIIQPIPKILIDNYYRQNDNNKVNLDGLEVGFARNLKVDNNSDFIMDIIVATYLGGSGEHGKWLKSDYEKFRDNESNFIQHFNNIIPSEFISKKESNDRSIRVPFYQNWHFKLLV